MNVMSQKPLFYLAGFAVLGVLVVVYFTHNKVIAHIPITTLGATGETSQMISLGFGSGANQEQALAKADAAIAAAQKLLIEPPVVEAEALEKSRVSWEIAAADDALKPSIPLSDKIKAYSVVKIDAHPVSFPVEGEKMTLPMFNGRSITANVESVQILSNGDRVWAGHLDGLGDDFPVVMTYGDHLTFATIHTPDGTYALESKDGVGWLYKNPSIAELSAPGYVDSLVPNDN